MKKFLLFAVFSAFTITTSNAQSAFRIGFKGGVNFASIGGDETGDLDGRTSFHLGALVEIPITKKFAIQPEILYSSLGAKLEDSDNFLGETVTYKEDVKLDYITVPIMAKYYVIEGLSIEAGPQIGVLVSAKDEYSVKGGGEDMSEEDDIKDETNTLDLGLGLGASYRLNNGLFFSGRYVFGLSNIIKGEDDYDFGDFDIDSYKRHNSVIQVSVGFSF